MTKLAATFTDAEYQAIRLAAMQGRLSASFKRVGDQVVFHATEPKLFCRQLENVVDFGATSATEVFGLDHA